MWGTRVRERKREDVERRGRVYVRRERGRLSTSGKVPYEKDVSASCEGEKIKIAELVDRPSGDDKSAIVEWMAKGTGAAHSREARRRITGSKTVRHREGWRDNYNEENCRACPAR